MQQRGLYSQHVCVPGVGCARRDWSMGRQVRVSNIHGMPIFLKVCMYILNELLAHAIRLIYLF